MLTLKSCMKVVPDCFTCNSGATGGSTFQRDNKGGLTIWKLGHCPRAWGL
ncbi:unnamed protein product [Staurois parvus]|uniref:Uncharacterized protein n=1 Tax=Staurois parvus TaxID=386267 RepID=A0ABN9BVN2_9NEOB|nr:unnamed protein product [Staurois parvus]